MTEIARIEPDDEWLFADALTITLAADPDRALNFGLSIEAEAPLGKIRLRLHQEQVTGLRDQLNRMAAMTDQEVAEFMDRLRGQQPPTEEQEK